MKAVKYLRPGVALCDVPEPNLEKPDDVKIRVEYASICASDVHMINGEWDWMMKEPRQIGHEAAGEIVALGPAASIKGLKVGDKVTYNFNEYCGKCFHCRNGQEHLCANRRDSAHGMAEYVVTGEQTVYKLPAGVDTLTGCMSEPVSVCLHGVDMMRILPGDNAAVYGAGGLGLLALQLVKLAGAGEVTVVEPLAHKREKALALGADHVLDPMAWDYLAEAGAVTGGLGFQHTIEVSGSASGAEAAFQTSARGGVVVYFGMYPAQYKLPVDMWDLFKKELTLCGVYQSPYMFPRVMRLLPKLNVADLTAAVFPLADFDLAWQAQLSRQYPKIVLKIS